VIAFNPFAWTARQQALADRAAAWVASGHSDALLLTAEQLAELDSWLGASSGTYPGIDQAVLEYIGRSRDYPKRGTR
jgi:hypothetical protein